MKKWNIRLKKIILYKELEDSLIRKTYNYRTIEKFAENEPELYCPIIDDLRLTRDKYYKNYLLFKY